MNFFWENDVLTDLYRKISTLDEKSSISMIITLNRIDSGDVDVQPIHFQGSCHRSLWSLPSIITLTEDA